MPITDFNVCRTDEVPDCAARGFDIHFGETSISLVVVNWDHSLLVYRNRCPHTGVELNWNPDQFFILFCEYLQCALHGALFRPTDGFCVYGPCKGDSLISVAAYVDGKWLRVKSRQL